MSESANQPLAFGNTAKLYCLEWIEQRLLPQNPNISILDLGCGEGKKFETLLRRHSSLSYVGVEPTPRRAETARRVLERTEARVITASADQFDKRWDHGGPFDVVTSFSVFEHVYDRPEYFRVAAAMLKNGGYFLINYDAGHFFDPKQWKKNVLGKMLARLGNQNYYQAFVPEEQTRAIIEKSGLVIKDEKFFNMANLKALAKRVPTEDKGTFMRRWLETELWINKSGITYDDDLAPVFLTRNFILRKQ